MNEPLFRQGEFGDLLGRTVTGVTFDEDPRGNGFNVIFNGGAKLKVLNGYERSRFLVLIPVGRETI